jgi:hypothetical protein
MVQMSREVVAATNDGYAIANAQGGVVEGGPWKALYALVVVLMSAVVGLWSWRFISRVCCCRGRPAKKQTALTEAERAAAATAKAEEISADGNGADGGGSDVGEEKVMKIWLSPAGDKFHWNRDCRGLAGVIHESRKVRTECLYCFRCRMADKEKAE